MEPILELESARLLLRQWRDEDLPEFAAMCADPQVMRYFPAPLSRLESASLIGRIRGHFAEHGFGLWALERKDTGAVHRVYRARRGRLRRAFHPGHGNRLAPGPRALGPGLRQ